MKSGRSGVHWRLLAVEETGPVQLENRGSLDELVLEEWLHLEQMDDHRWWMRLGDARVLAERDDQAAPERLSGKGSPSEVIWNLFAR